MPSGLGRGLGRGLSQLGQQLMMQAEDKKRQDRQDKMLIDERLFQQGQMDDREAAQRRNMGVEYGLREQLERAQNPTIRLPLFGDTGVTTGGLAELMRSMAYQQDVQQRANKPTAPRRDYAGEKIAVEKWKKDNLPPKTQPTPRRTEPEIPVVINGQTIMMTPREAAAMGYYYQPPAEPEGPGLLDRIRGLFGGGEPQPDPYDELFRRLSQPGS